MVSSHSGLGNTGKNPVISCLKSHICAGYDVDIASPKGGLPPMDECSRKLADVDNRRFPETAADWCKMENSIPLSVVNSGDYQAIIFAGGHCTIQ